MIERLVWIVPLVVVILGVWRPQAGILAFVAALPMFGGPPGGPYLAALDVACLAAILTAWRTGEARASPLTAPAAAFVAVSLLSLVPSPYLPPSWQPSTLLALLRAMPGVETWSTLYSWRSAVDLVLGFLLFLATRRAFAGRSVRPLFGASLAGLCLVLSLGLAAEAGLVDLTGYRPEVPSGSGQERMQSIFFLSGWLAQYLVIATPAALALLWSAPTWTRPLILLVPTGVLLALALAQARGAWLSVGTQILVALRPRWVRQLATRNQMRAILAIVALTAVCATTIVYSRSSDAFDREDPLAASIDSRRTLWKSAVEMARQRPLLGQGLGTFSPTFDLLAPPGSDDARAFHVTAHNLYLHVAAERGLLGLAALGLLGWVLAVSLRNPKAGARGLALAIGLGLTGAATYGLVQYVFFLRSLHWLLWVFVAAAALTTNIGSIGYADRLARILALGAFAVLPLRVFAPPTLLPAGSHSFGFHEPEVSSGIDFRWTGALAVERIPAGSGDLVLRLANGHPDGAQRPVEVVVSLDGKHLETLSIEAGWEEHRISVPPSDAAHRVLTLKVAPTFRPFRDLSRSNPAERSRDVRSLGVAVAEIRWEP